MTAEQPKDPPYWGVYPKFLKKGQFTKAKRDDARQWCIDNCEDKFISSDLRHWGFLNKKDAEKFFAIYGESFAYFNGASWEILIKPEEQ